MKNRFLIFFVAFSFLFSTSRAYALVPLIPGVVPLLTYMGATAQLATAIDYSIVLHGAILAIALDQSKGAATNSTSNQLTVKLNPKDPLPTPAGWNAPASGSIFPTPPSTTAGIYGPPYMTVKGSFSTQSAACAAFDDATHKYTSGGYLNTTQMTCVMTYTPTGATTTPSGTINLTLGCPSGYTLSGSTCNLTTSANVKKPADNNCQITRSGNAYSVDPQDPDCASGQPAMLGSTIAANSITMTRNDGSTASVTLNADGTATAKETYPDLANNKTKSLNTSYSAPDSGTGAVTLQGISTSSVDGVGNLATSGTGGTGPTGPTGDGQLVVDKLNAQDAAAEAAAAAGTASNLPQHPANVSELGLPTTNPFAALLPNSVNNLPLPNSGAGGCVGLSVSLPYMGTMSLEPCGLVEAVRPMVNYLLVTLGVLGGILVWIRPEGGAA